MLMNRQMNMPAMQRIMMEFDRQGEMMEMKQEMMDDSEDDGDILCFLPTGEDIDEAVEMAEHELSSPQASGRRWRRAACLPLYGDLPPRVQAQPFLPRSD